MFLKHGGRRGGGGRGSGGDDDACALRLPPEPDRKAILGCLAVALNASLAARRRRRPAATAANGEATAGDDTNDNEVKFSLHDDGPDRSLDGRGRSGDADGTRRARAFAREILAVATELLYLAPDHASFFLSNLDIECEDVATEREVLFRPFLESLSGADELFSGEERPEKKADGARDGKGEGSQSGLETMRIVGYDGRVRHAFKCLAVAVLSHFDAKEHAFLTRETAAAHAARKFEALEDGIVRRLSTLSRMAKDEKGGDNNSLTGQKKQSTMGQAAVRGLKITAAGVAAGTLFAASRPRHRGGGIAALAGTSSAVTVIATILLLPAATTIFGVGGGALVASKMSERTAGLTDFNLERIPDGGGGDGDGDSETPGLSRTVCVGGWLRDEHDASRPFGTTPRGLTERRELLCRFCSIYAPEVVPRCSRVLEEWRGREDELWDAIRSSYGKDPCALLPLAKRERRDARLLEAEDAAVDELVREMGLKLPANAENRCKAVKGKGREDSLPPVVDLLSDVLAPRDAGAGKKEETRDATLRSYKAWDFHAEYGDELYIVSWERRLLLELYGTAKEFQKDLAKKAAGEALKKTAMASLMVAVALPAALLSLSNIIDEKWTLVSERADEAGVLLAQSLLNSDAGHRPVSLVGFSFGARVILSCIMELARNQAIWERQQENTSRKEEERDNMSKAASLKKSISSMSSRRMESDVRFSREPASIVEDVVLMGCPASVHPSTWLSCRRVVGGRLVNCFSQHDMILALMYRIKNISKIMSPPVGIRDVDAPGVENYDVSRYVASHVEYCVAVREILEFVSYDQPTS
ncbi:hypothetical protein ACHAWF_010149 [Thalassiosira exigua]